MKIANGTPVRLRVGEVRYLICCDCHLAHLLVVDKIGKDTVDIKFYRDDYATAQERKKKRKKKKVK